MQDLPKSCEVGKSRYEKHEVEVGGTTFRIYKHYELIRIVGSGAFGVVGSGKNTLTNTNVAIKKVSFIIHDDQIPNLFNDLIDAKRVLREIKLLSIIIYIYTHHRVLQSPQHHLVDRYHPT